MAASAVLLAIGVWRAPLLTLAFLYQTTLIALNRECSGLRLLLARALSARRLWSPCSAGASVCQVRWLACSLVAFSLASFWVIGAWPRRASAGLASSSGTSSDRFAGDGAGMSGPSASSRAGRDPGRDADLRGNSQRHRWFASRRPAHPAGSLERDSADTSGRADFAVKLRLDQKNP